MLATPLLTVSFLLLSVHALNVTIWADKMCRGALNDMRKFYAIPDDGCFVRGEVDTLLALEGRNGETEDAITVSINDEPSQSEFAVFFTSDDCNPDNIIEDVFLESGCMDPKAKDYKSWAVWDTCAGEEGCSLGL
jgi:hypothetical protein